MSVSTNTNRPDGGWGWAVVFGSFMISFTCDGFAYSMGIFYTKFLVIYKESEFITSLFNSIMTAMVFGIGPLSNGLTAVYGCKAVAILGSILSVIGMLLSVVLDSIYSHCLTLGVITGSGLGLTLLPHIIIVSEWFDKRLTFATGLSVCGSGFGMAVFIVLSENLTETFGWKGCMVLLSAVMLLNVFFSSLFRPNIHQKANYSLKSALKMTLNFEILKERVYLYYAFSSLVRGAVFYMPFIFIKEHIDIINESGPHSDSENTALTFIIVVGLSNAFGRGVFGYIADSVSLNRTILFALSITICGITMGFIGAFAQHFPVIIITGIVFGIAQGAYVCLSSVVMIDLFGVHRVSNVYGITNLILGIASLVGSPLIALTVDTTHTKTGYRTGFYISSVLTIFSGILIMFLPFIHRKYKYSNK